MLYTSQAIYTLKLFVATVSYALSTDQKSNLTYSILSS